MSLKEQLVEYRACWASRLPWRVMIAGSPRKALSMMADRLAFVPSYRASSGYDGVQRIDELVEAGPLSWPLPPLRNFVQA
jgi:hypothetical protein